MGRMEADKTDRRMDDAKRGIFFVGRFVARN